MMWSDNLLNDLKEQERYDPDEAAAKGCLSAGMTFVVFVIACVLCALVGCTTTKYVPVIEYHTDTLIKNVYRYDSIYKHDSVYINQYIKGDTVFRDRDRWHTEYRDRWMHDSVYINKTDSIPVPYPVEKKVPAELSWWQQTQIHGFRLAVIIIALIVAWKKRKTILNWIRRFID